MEGILEEMPIDKFPRFERESVRPPASVSSFDLVPTVSKVAPLLVGFSLGAALMYLFDPRSGRGRRARMSQKGIRMKNQTLHYGGKLSRDLRNRMEGARARLFQIRSSKEVNDQILHDRIRSSFGRVVSHPRAVHVEVEGGIVTLTGTILKSEVPSLLYCVRSVPGVDEVRNHLQMEESADNIPSLQNGNRASAA